MKLGTLVDEPVGVANSKDVNYSTFISIKDKHGITDDLRF